MKFYKLILLIILLVTVFCVNCQAVENSAVSAVLINADTFTVIYSKNAECRMPMASTTKIMTALILAEQNTPDKTVCATKEMVYVEGSSMGLKVGDTVNYADLLYGIMLPSGNDAANTAAISVSGSIKSFANLMNQKVKAFGLHNTNFVTPSGLDAANHYTTAYDLAVITAYALRNESFLKAASSKNKEVTISGNTVTLQNHNKLLKMYDGAIGVKTGFTKRSGRCLVSAAKRGNTTLIAVTLNDKNDWQDHIALLDYGFSQTKESVIVPKCNKFLPLLSSSQTSVELEFEPLEIGTNGEEISYEIFLPRVILAPIDKGDIVGTTCFYANGKHIATKNICAKFSYKSDILSTSFFDRLANFYLYLIRSI